MRYRPEIDGLRTVAVIPVILFHAGFGAFSGGFVGVDVFFVISGYLITSLIHEEMLKGGFSVVRFYERRARRILPALVTVCLACIPFALAWMMPGQLEDFAESLIAVNLFVSNFLFWGDSGYFAAPAELKPLLHTWSLAIEEQFYIVFPLFLLACRGLSGRRLIQLLALLAVVSLALAEIGWRHYPVGNFFLLTSRAWELELGAILALGHGAWSRAGRGIAETGSLLGLGLILVAVFAFDGSLPFPSLWGLVPVVGTALVIACARPGTLVGRLLGSAPMVGLGLLSYSAYLWHQPLFAFARIRLGGEVPPAAYLALSLLALLLAFLSWRFVERPFRDRARFGRRQIFAGSAAAMTVLCTAAAVAAIADGLPGRFSPRVNEILNVRAGSSTPCENRLKDLKAVREGEVCIIGADARPTIAVLGDSHGDRIAGGLSPRFERLGIGAAAYFGSWCAPLYGFGTTDPHKNLFCRRLVRAAYGHVLRDQRISTVILAAEWPNYTTGRRWGDPYASPYDDGVTPNADPAANPAHFARALERTVELLLARGKRVVFVKTVPEYEFEVPQRLAGEIAFDRPPAADAVTPAGYARRNEGVSEALAALASPRLLVVDTPGVFCDATACRYATADGVPLYTDGSHLSDEGAARLAAEIVDRLRGRGWLDGPGG